MTEQKYVILAAIHNLKPNSLYQLAKLVDRDFANVKSCSLDRHSDGYKMHTGHRAELGSTQAIEISIRWSDILFYI